MRDRLCSLFAEMVRLDKSARQIHLDTLARHADRFARTFSADGCLSCLRRRPRYRLPCHHMACDLCVRVFWTPVAGDPCLHRGHRCVLCQATTGTAALVRVSTALAGESVLSVDGGGVRGVAVLETLRALEREIGLPVPLQRFFSMASGVSSGECCDGSRQSSSPSLPLRGLPASSLPALPTRSRRRMI